MDLLDLPELGQKWDRFWESIGVDASFVWLIGAAIVLLIIVNVPWQRILRPSYVTSPRAATDSKREIAVIHALFWIVYSSAWMRWQEAQRLANDSKTLTEQIKMWLALSHFQDKIDSGDLIVRAKQHDSIAYETVDKDFWKSAALNIQPDKKTLWRVHIMVRQGVSEKAAKQIPGYDSFIVSEQRFEKMWPKKDKNLDRATKKLLKQVKRKGYTSSTTS